MSIQQAFNNMLMSAQVAAGFYAHSPAGQEAFQKRQEEKTSTSIDQARKELQAMYETGEYEDGKEKPATPEEKEKIKRVLEREKSLRQTQFDRDPHEYEELYSSSLEDLRLLEEGQMSVLGFKRGAAPSVPHLKEKTDTKSEQKYAFHSRFKTLKEGVKTAHTRTINQEKWRKRALPGGDE